MAKFFGKRKSAADYKKFRGVISYAQLYTPDEFKNAANWKLNLHPDADTIQEIKDCGIQLTLKDKPAENAEGKFFTFKRPTEKLFASGKTFFCPPRIYDADGNSLIHYELDGEIVTQFKDEDADVERIGEPILIGNGSLVEIEVEVYQTGSFGKGNRLISVKILDLIEYIPPEEVEKEEEKEEEKPRQRAETRTTTTPARRGGKAPF